tara:strand:- start:723 stop:2087 length:1365 start_codon:yes stop_codon:yes gene_type:complete
MVIILLSNSATISGIDKDTIKLLSKYLTIDNPLFFKRLDMGLQNWGVPRNLKYCNKLSDTSVEIPIGALGSVIELLKGQNFNITKDDIIDKRVSNIQSSFFDNLKFTATLRGYQEDIVQSCMKKSIGVVEAMTGAGKTVTFVAMSLRRKEPTLILVNTLELANQTVNAFVKFTNLKAEDIGFVGNGRFEVKPITVGLHQTMAKLDDVKFNLINERIGQVIGDEIHIIAAETWYNTMSKIKAKYKFGFSATPKRDDGLTEVIHYASGPIIHSVPKEELEDYLITPTVEYINTEYTYPLISTQEYQELIADLSQDKTRNELILDTLKKENRPTCLLCLRLSQVDYFQEKLGDKAVSLTSKMTKKARKAVMEKLTKGEVSIVISTYGLFSTGIDVPQLEVLLLAAPIRSEIKLRQSAGRLMRLHEGKTSAKIIDFVDVGVDLLKFQSRKRKQILEKL